MRRRGSEKLAPPIGMSDHTPETDIKCRLIELKCVLSNLLSVYTLYTDNIALKTCCQCSVS